MVEESYAPGAESSASAPAAGSAIAALRRFTKPRPPEPEERCELCNVRLAPLHRHLLDMRSRKAACSCDACGLLFENVEDGRFKLIPRDARPLPEFRMTDAEWEGLALPINLAFFFRSTPAQKVLALYPSPAGATESLLPMSSWDELVAGNPALAGMQSDVEALLVNRVGQTRKYFIAPMDACYELVGLIRMHWRGLAGGEAVWNAIGAFFDKLESGAPR